MLRAPYGGGDGGFSFCIVLFCPGVKSLASYFTLVPFFRSFHAVHYNKIVACVTLETGKFSHIIYFQAAKKQGITIPSRSPAFVLAILFCDSRYASSGSSGSTSTITFIVDSRLLSMNSYALGQSLNAKCAVLNGLSCTFPS